MADSVNHPKHYNSNPSGVECIDVVEHMSFNVGNAMKYLWRADHKNGLEDLKKARWYIEREIQRVFLTKLTNAVDKLVDKIESVDRLGGDPSPLGDRCDS